LAEPETRRSHTYEIAAAIGLTAVTGYVAFTAALLILRPGGIVTGVSYERLVAGELAAGETLVQVDAGHDDFDYSQTGSVEMVAATDPADELLDLFAPQPGHRLIEFQLLVENESWEYLEVTESDFRLKAEDGSSYSSLLVFTEKRLPPFEVGQGESAAVIVFFELPRGIDPAELTLRMEHHVHRTLVYRLD
jgi:hypothetical protein